jgi:hypothetical protein
MDAMWDQIESITLRLNLNMQGTPSSGGGLMLIFAIPYRYHTRAVTLRIKTITGKAKTLHLRVNLTKLNHLLALLADVSMLEGTRSEVDISKKKMNTKRKQANLRAQWQFLPFLETYRRPTISDFYIRDEHGDRWQKNYSPQAQIMKKVGWGAILSLFGIVFLFPLHISFEDNPLLWTILLVVFGVLFCFGFILAWFTPEMRENSKIM